MQNIFLILFILFKINFAFADLLKIEKANEAFNNNNYEDVINYLSGLDLDGNVDASYILAYSNYELENYEDAFKNYLICAELGEAYCQNNVGYAYDNGVGVEINYKEAYYWFEKAKLDSNVKPYALTSLAAMYLEGRYVNQSYIKAFEHYEEAAENGFDRALYALGLMYEKGEGTPRNYNKAKKYYLKAHENGHELALDRKEALEGDVERSLKMALIYTYGTYFDEKDYISIGISIEENEALFWFKIVEFLNNNMGDDLKSIFNDLYNNASNNIREKAFNNFEFWKKNSGFEYNNETLDDISPFLLAHTGTGFYINSEYLLTNKHVSHIDDNYTVKCDKIVGYDPYNGIFETYENVETKYLPNFGDVDLLKATKKIDIFETILSNKDINMGSNIAIIGFPTGREMSKYPKITSGIVSSEYGHKDNPSEFISDATSYGGSSGSPVYSIDGSLIGILWGGPPLILRDIEGRETGSVADPNISYVLKSSYIKDFLDLNNISYKTNNPTFWSMVLNYIGFNSSDELSLSEISSKEKNKVRLLSCFAS